VEAFNEKYFDAKLVNGAIPICHVGRALRRWLAITGPERGHDWRHDRGDQTGLYPLRLPDADHVTFIDWYLDWLRDAQDRLSGKKRRD
jgi:hypothetical protein